MTVGNFNSTLVERGRLLDRHSVDANPFLRWWPSSWLAQRFQSLKDNCGESLPKNQI